MVHSGIYYELFFYLLLWYNEKGKNFVA